MKRKPMDIPSMETSTPPIQRIKNKNVVYTIVSKNYLPMAAVMIDSFLDHNPGWDCKILLCDNITSEDEKKYISNIPAEIIPLLSLQDSCEVNLQELCFKYSVVELNTAVKPLFLEYLFSKGYSTVIYLDPDILIFHSFSGIEGLLEHYDIILTPHITTPLPEDGYTQTDHDILCSGAYNLGFLALKNSPEARRLIAWWQKKLENSCYSRVEEGLFTDQKWMDLAPSFCDNLLILKDKTYNVAFWNIHERRVERKGGPWLVNGEPIIFFHFSGIVINDLERISKHQNRYSLHNRPELADLFFTYRELLMDRGLEQFAGKKYWFGYLPGTDIEIPLFLRNFWQEIAEAGIHPYDPEHIPLIIQFANESVLWEPPISRLWMEIYQRRPDVQRAFPNIERSTESREAFINWLQLHGRYEYHLDEVFVEIEEQINP